MITQRAEQRGRRGQVTDRNQVKQISQQKKRFSFFGVLSACERTTLENFDIICSLYSTSDR
jgi:hypothetical protein